MGCRFMSIVHRPPLAPSLPHVSHQKIPAKVEVLMNVQVGSEAAASHYYLACASIADQKRMEGISEFLYGQAQHERDHMLKLMRYINTRGGVCTLRDVPAPAIKLGSFKTLFEGILELEESNTYHINCLLDTCLDASDHISHQFLQWYAAEQVEEEGLVKGCVDKLSLIGDDKTGLYCFDRDLLLECKRHRRYSPSNRPGVEHIHADHNGAGRA